QTRSRSKDRGYNACREVPNMPACRMPVIATLGLIAAACAGLGMPFAGASLLARQGGNAMALKLKSLSFENGGNIPKEFTCHGAALRPALERPGPPPNARNFGLIADAPDAPSGTWVHWVLWNLPASAHNLPQGVPKRAELDGGAQQGQNDFGKNGYGG